MRRFAVVVMAIMTLVACRHQGPQPKDILKLGPFVLAAARTPQEQAQGLMWQQTIPSRTGMTFPLVPPRAARFWMKNCRVALDMVFVGPDGRVQGVVPALPQEGGPVLYYTVHGPKRWFEAFTGPLPITAMVIEVPAGEGAAVAAELEQHVR